jgi:putative phosphoesterase
VTRVAVISDTHLPRGNRALPDRCVELCRGADLLLHCGDVVALEVWHELQTLGPPLEGVHGNMDEPALRELLPKQHVVEVAGARIGMVHIPGPATGHDSGLALRFPGCHAVIYGHTHVPEVARFGEVWILNPGSPTERRRAPTHAMLMLEVGQGEIRPELVRL